MRLSEYRRYKEDGSYEALSTKEYNDIPEHERDNIRIEITFAGGVFIVSFTAIIVIGIIAIPKETLLPLVFIVLCLAGGLKLFK